MSDSLVAELAAFGVGVRRDGVGADRGARVAGLVRDVAGVALAAGHDWPDDPVTALVRRWGGPRDVPALGRAGRFPAAHAAFVGGTLAHALDFDDTHLPSVLHPSAAIVPAALAAAVAAGADGATLLAAVAVGDEICCRLGMAGYDAELRNSLFFEAGLHATAICGAVGASAAAALAAGLPEDLVAHALAIATSFGAGVLEANRTGGTVKRVHCGWAAHAGVTAAELAAGGLTGPRTAIEGRFGFLRAFCGEAARPEAVTAGLGARWEIDRLHVKPYPSNHFTHAVIDLALALRERGLRAEDIAEVELGLAAPVLRTVAEPPALKAAPPSGYAARFSAPFAFAAALAGGGGLGLDLDDFSDARAHDPALLEVAARVRCVADERCERIFPDELPAVARVRAADGAELELEVLTNRGGPARPLSPDELAAKFHGCAGRALDGDRVDALGELLGRLPELGALDELAALAGADAVRERAPATDRPVRTIAAQTATPASFAPFGEVLVERGSGLAHVYGDRLDTYAVGRLESDAPVQFIRTRSRLRELHVRFLERHRGITQTFIPLGGDPIVLAVAAPDAPLVDGVPAPESIRAFVVPGDVAVNLHRGTWHEVPFPLVDDSLTLVTSHAGVTDGWAELDAGAEIDRLDEEKRDVTRRTGVEVRIDADYAAGPA